MPQRSRLSADHAEPNLASQRTRVQVRPLNAPTPAIIGSRRLPPDVLTPESVLALQRSVGNRAVGGVLAVQRGRTTNVKAKLAKERIRRKWKSKRLWPEQALKGRILEVTDKYMFRRKKHGGYIDMNKVASNFPAIDGIANNKFRQVKAYLHLGLPTKKARKSTVARIVAQVEDLTEKCETAAQRLTKHEGRLLVKLLDIDAGRASTKGRTGKAPYAEVNKSPAARMKHKSVLPPSFRLLADTQIAGHTADPANFEFDTDSLAQEMMKSMVVVVPDDLVTDVQKAVTSLVTVEGGGFTSTEIKELMDVEGYAPSKRGEEDEDYVED